MHYVAGLTGLDHQAGQLTFSRFYQMVVYRGRGKQRRNRYPVAVGSTVTQNEQSVTFVNSFLRFLDQLIECFLQILSVITEEHREHRRTELALGKRAKFLEVVVCQNRMRQFELSTVFGTLGQEVTLATDKTHQ